MSQIRTAKAGDVAAFPGSKFVVDQTPPIAQCQETQLPDPDTGWDRDGSIITASVSLAAIDLTGKSVTIAGSISDNGTYDILSQNGQLLTVNHIFTGFDDAATGTYHDTGQAYLTRSENSFRKFIENQSKAHTTKGGQLFTDLTDPPMNAACSDTWNPD